MNTGKVVVWAALMLAILSLAVNGVTLATVSQQQAMIRNLQAEVKGLVAVQEVSTVTDQHIADALDELWGKVGYLMDIQAQDRQAIHGLIENDVVMTDILDWLVTLAEH